MHFVKTFIIANYVALYTFCTFVHHTYIVHHAHYVTYNIHDTDIVRPLPSSSREIFGPGKDLKTICINGLNEL